MENPLLALAGLAALCGVCQWLAWYFKLPSILFLLTGGILVGPVLGVFDPDALLGDLMFPFVSLAVAIILFEGGLTLKLSDIRGHGAVVTRLISVGVLITWALLTVTVHFVFGMPWPIALVFGSITVVSGPTVVKPILQSVRPTDKVGHILHWEGILIDPIGVFLALMVFDYVLLDAQGASAGAGHVAIILLKLVAIGTAVGMASGYLTAMVLRRYLVPDYLVNVLTLITVIAAFTLAETLQHESGLLAVTIMGVWLANAKGLHIDEILHFKEDLSVLLISGLFIVLASRLEIGLIPQYGWQILALLLIAQFLIRPLNAWLCTLGSGLTTSERGFLGWIAPRGIVVAAVSSLFVLRLQEEGVEMAELLVPLTFSLIIGTVVFQSLTAKPLASRLGISNPEPNGVLFFGANPIGIALASALRDESVKVILSDTSWRNVREARAAGFDTYHGNPTSGHAAENLELQGVGKLIAVSSNRDTNALAGMHFRREFGASSVFTLEGTSDDEAYERFDTANRNRAHPLFDKALSHSRLARLLRDGEIVHLSLEEPVVAENGHELTPADLADPDAADKGRKPLEDGDVELAPESDEYDGTKVNGDKDGEPHELLSRAQDIGIGTGAEPDMKPVVNHAVESDANSGAEPDAQTDAVLAATSAPAAAESFDPMSLVEETDLRLFAIDKDGTLFVYGAGEAFSPKAGWRVIVLRKDDDLPMRENNNTSGESAES